MNTSGIVVILIVLLIPLDAHLRVLEKKKAFLNFPQVMNMLLQREALHKDKRGLSIRNVEIYYSEHVFRRKCQEMSMLLESFKPTRCYSTRRYASCHEAQQASVVLPQSRPFRPRGRMSATQPHRQSPFSWRQQSRVECAA